MRFFFRYVRIPTLFQKIHIERKNCKNSHFFVKTLFYF